MKSYHNLLAALAATLMLTACSTEFDPAAGTRPIGFSPATDGTRAMVESAAQMQAFQVWGWYGAGDTRHQVFGGTQVNRTGNDWTYSPAQYWTDETYDFYALHPAGLAGAAYDADGNLTIAGFRCGAGAQAVDLMTATNATGIDGAGRPVVGLDFQHELVRIGVNIKSDINTTVQQLQLTGMPMQGDYRLAADAGGGTWSNVAAGTVRATAGSSIDMTAGGELADAFGPVLAIPQPAAGSTPTLHFTYENETDGTVEVKDIALRDPDEWKAGTSVRYICTITGAEAQITMVITVMDWEDGPTVTVPPFN